LELLTDEQIKNLSFPDAEVKSFELEVEGKIFRCTTDLSFISGSENRMVGNTSLIFRNWTSLSIKEWDGKNFVPIDKKNLKSSELKDIGENSFGNEIILRGFTVGTNFWTEYKFLNAEVTVEVDPQSP
jgi:hypothetical protein